MSQRALRFRRVQPSRRDIRAEISARELMEDDLTTTRPIPVITGNFNLYGRVGQ